MAGDTIAPNSEQGMVDLTNLSKSMHTVTKSYHTELRRLIHSKLARALPPACTSPKLYARGLLQFATVYMTFESLWERWAQYESEDAIPYDTAMVLSGLIHLQLPELQRSERIINDLSALLKISAEDVVVRMVNPEGQKLKEFLAHIERRIRAKPHVLIAYAWVFYLVLFDGSYSIRNELISARQKHWHLYPSPHPYVETETRAMCEPQDRGISFWYFPGNGNGLALKEEFKQRLAEVDGMLSKQQATDIVLEARRIFRHCIALIDELAVLVAADKKAELQRKVEVAFWYACVLPLVIIFLGVLMKWYW